MPIFAVARFERFFRAAAHLDVDKNDLKRYSDFVVRKLHDLLLAVYPPLDRALGEQTEERAFKILDELI